MRMAIFSDLHGNPPALTEELADMDAHSTDALVCLVNVATDDTRPN